MSAKGIKLTNEKSTVQQVVPLNTEDFEQSATEAVSRMTEYKKRAWDLGVRFKGLMENSVLSENKSLLVKDLEAEILAQLSTLAIEINNDDAQPEGMGSVALSQLLMKMILLQKDAISMLRFRIEQLEKNSIVPT